ncbi:hypothetical protein OsJ_05827 [Oryza sativa Japonica Group]|uniref:Uncharacterized protein n=1 Tax=Oryza sativa subsp. japonica TaxID=39947 RepID=B9F3Y0_ORYSJ|nr:hypothetical protein OsJ_05827 [Oryza sativa Japonica Group]
MGDRRMAPVASRIYRRHRHMGIAVDEFIAAADTLGGGGRLPQCAASTTQCRTKGGGRCRWATVTMKAPRITRLCVGCLRGLLLVVSVRGFVGAYEGGGDGAERGEGSRAWLAVSPARPQAWINRENVACPAVR